MLLLAMAVSSLRWSKKPFFPRLSLSTLCSKFSSLAQKAGADPIRSVRFAPSPESSSPNLVRLMHGAQLGWTWGLVSLPHSRRSYSTSPVLWTGTVVASFLLHPRLQFHDAFTSIIATKGFTHMPPGH